MTVEQEGRSANSSQDGTASIGVRPPSSVGCIESESDNMADAMEIEVHANEVVAWAQLSHLRDWLPSTQRIRMIVPMEATPDRVTDTMRLCGNLFHSLEHMQIKVAGAKWEVTQVLIGAMAELGRLRSLRLEGGRLMVEDMRLHVLSGLKQLESLALLPVTGDGLNDEHLSDGLALLTGLTSLEFRGCPELVTDEGLSTLGGLTRLRQLSILPLGLQVTQAGLGGLCQRLGHLQLLKAGFSQSKQVDVMQSIPARVGHMAVIIADPHAEVSPLFTTVATCLEATLSSLKITSTIKVDDAFFMVALGALHALTELRVSVAPAKPTSSFVINMGVLAPLKQLQKLELNVVGSRAKLLLTPALVTSLAASWPDLTQLALSCMVAPERLATGQSRGPLQPLALTQLGAFSKLQSLTLIAPLADMEEDDSHGENHHAGSKHADSTSQAAETVMVALNCLPGSLEVLELERAHVVPALPKQQQEQGQQGTSDAPQGRTTLANLRTLALGRCEVNDEMLQGLFASSHQITHLELNEVSGITGASLRALSTLSLHHLEVVDTRQASALARKASAQPPPQPPTNSWWGWLVGAQAPATPDAASLPPTPRAPPPMLRHADIAALSALSTMRHLQWAVGRPLGLPHGSLSDSEGHLIDDPEDLSSGARMALDDLWVARQAIAALPDLHEVYLDTSARGVAAEDIWEESMVSSWLSQAAKTLASGAEAANKTIIQLARTESVSKTADAAAAAAAAAAAVAEAQAGGDGSSNGGARAPPKWLVEAVKPGCFCAGSLPVSRHDPWSGQDFYQVL